MRLKVLAITLNNNVPEAFVATTNRLIGTENRAAASIMMFICDKIYGYHFFLQKKYAVPLNDSFFLLDF